MTQKRMWTRYELKTIRDPRLMQLGRSARLMHFEALAYSNEYGTDGVITKHDLRLFSDAARPAKVAGDLADAGMWVRNADESWTIVGFHDDQMSAEEVEKRYESQRVREERRRRHNAGDHSKCDPQRCRVLVGTTRVPSADTTRGTCPSDTKRDDTTRNDPKGRESGVEKSENNGATAPTGLAPGALPGSASAPNGGCRLEEGGAQHENHPSFDADGPGSLLEGAALGVRGRMPQRAAEPVSDRDAPSLAPGDTDVAVDRDDEEARRAYEAEVAVRRKRNREFTYGIV